MARTATKSAPPQGQDPTAHLGFEAKLWLAADTAPRASASRESEATSRDLRGAQDHHCLGEPIDLIGSSALTCRPDVPTRLTCRPGAPTRRIGDGAPTRRIGDGAPGEGTGPTSSRRFDRVGRVFEYFLTQSASAEGENGGPAKCEVRSASVEVQPVQESKFAVRHFTSFAILTGPACGSGGMFVQSEKFVESHGGQLGDIAIYGFISC